VRVSVLAFAFAVSFVSPRAAHACGGSGPGGTGMCAMPTHSARSLALPIRVGASFALTDTTILFGRGRRADMTRTAAFGTFALPVAPRMAFETSVGGFLDGELRTPASKVRLGPGLVTALGLSVRAVDGAGASPLVVASATLSSTYARGEASRNIEAYDLRATVMIGKTLGGVLTPYALGRAFGGPVWFRWDDGARAQGTDLYKYQVGAGLSVALRRVDAFVEAVPLGERSLSAGLGLRL
jgi:hypothetical protein